MSSIDRTGPWAARAAWLVLGLVAAAPLAEALELRSTPVRWVASALLGLAWTGGLVALLVPRTSSLTALRIVVPAGLAAALAVASEVGSVGAAEIVMVTAASLAVAAVLAPWFTEAWVDGSSYGSEHRIPLQTPPLLALVVVPITWAAVVVSLVAGPLLLAARQWLPGLVAVALGAFVAHRAAMSLHQLSRRWVVMVPTGMVVHDPLTLPEPHLFLRTSIAGIHPAEAGTDAMDLTAGATGLALQLDLSEPVDMLVRRQGRTTATVEETSLLFTPARPRHLLDRARENRIRVGA